MPSEFQSRRRCIAPGGIDVLNFEITLELLASVLTSVYSASLVAGLTVDNHL